jgi:tetratricopeptide (TPR) repeat protein
MTQLQKVKHEARRAEQRSNWPLAIELYKDAIRLDERSGGSASDIAIYNRIGDLYLRQGDTAAAVDYYEQAVDRYASHDLKTSAIALCNKILRIAPDDDEVYRKLGRLHASNGLLAEARGSFLEFAGRMQHKGEITEALEAVQEFVNLTGDEEIRVVFAERLLAGEMSADAAAQLRLVYEARAARGANAEAIRSRILEIDPGADPRADSDPGIASTPEPRRNSSSTAAAGQERSPTKSVVAPPDTEPTAGDTVRLSQLVLNDLGDEAESLRFVPEVTRSEPAAPADYRGAELSEDMTAILTRFRAQVSEIVEDTDYTVHYDLGVAYLGMGLLDEAIGEFQLSIQSPTMLAPAHALLGECLSARQAGGEVDPSAADDRGVSDLDLLSPADELLQDRAEGGESLQLEEPTEPEPAAESSDSRPELETMEPTEEEQAEELAGLLFKARLAQYRSRQAQAESRTDHAAHLELGLAYLRMGLLAEATRDLDVAAAGPRAISGKALEALNKIAEDPDEDPDIRVSALRSLAGHGRRDQALEAALELHGMLAPDEPLREAVLELIRAIDPASDAAQPASEAGTAEPMAVDQAEDPIAETDQILAGIEDFEDDLEPKSYSPSDAPTGPASDAVEDSPHEVTPGAAVGQDPEVLFEEGLASLAAGRPEQASEQLYGALELFEQQRQIPRAVAVVDRLLELKPNDVVLHHQKAEYAIMSNDRVVLIQSYLDLAACLRRQNAPRAARTVYGRVLDVDPGHGGARAGISELDEEEVRREGQSARRAPVASGAADVETASDVCVPRETSTGHETRPPDAAREPSQDFDTMLSELRTHTHEGTPVDFTSHYELGVAFAQMAMWEEAARELQAAVRGLEDPLPAYELLGECLIALEKYGVAERVLAVAEALPTGDDVEKLGILYFLGLACLLGGDASTGREYLERVCTVDIGYRDAAARLSSLSE